MKKKSGQYDDLKVIATILVVLAHITRMYTGRGVVVPARSSGFLSGVTDFIYAFHMPLFMCVSGAVYGMCTDDLGKYTDRRKFIKNKACRLLLPYAAFGLLYVAPVMTLCGFTESYARYSVQGILLATDSRHLWYLLSLFSIFCLFDVFGNLIKKVSPVILFPVFACLSLISGYAPSYFSINYTLNYILYFYMGGYFLNHHYEKIASVCGKKHILLGLLILDCGLYLFRSCFGVSVCLAVTGIFLMLGLVQHLSPAVRTKRFYQIIKKDGMGIYLFHPMIIYVLFYYLGGWNAEPVLLTCLVFAAALALSVIFTELLRKLRLQLLLGEFV